MLEFVICVSSALIMVLEMVGARVMAPYLGTSIIVWTSLIGVVLACLAVGAYFGGRLADKKLSLSVLAQILSASGIGCVLTAVGHGIVGSAVTQNISNIYIATLVVAVSLFALPAVFFGMISPYIVRLRLLCIDTAGATVGRLYALSTAGSIVGTFLGGFVLVSFFPNTYILLGAALCMFALAFLVYRGGGMAQNMTRLLVLLFVPLAAFGNFLHEQNLAAQGIQAPIETLYSSIRVSTGRVSDGRVVRLISTGPDYSQSGAYVDNPTELLFAYTRHYALATALFPHAHSVLMLGGGGYSLPKWLLAGHGGLDSESLRLDVVELDPGMTQLAYSDFGLVHDARMHIYHDDARRFINKNRQRYDLVFVDVFNSHYAIPFHMGTVEAGRALRRAVKDDGAVMMNIISAVKGDAGRIFESIYGALALSFAEVHVFAVYPQTPLEDVQNLIVLCFPTPKPQLLPILEGKVCSFSPSVQKILDTRITTDIMPQTPPLWDDFAPVERYAQALLQ